MLPLLQTVRAGVALAAAAAVTLAACSTPEDETHSEEEGHAHHAQHGGVLVPLGDHFANVEVVHDAEAGTLVVYGLDGHAEGSERIATESLSVSLDTHGDEPIVVALAPRVGALSGETVGDSSYFSVESEALKGIEHFHGVIGEIMIKGTKFETIKFDWPPEEHEHADGEEHGGE